MSVHSSSLFREEALRYRADRLQGSVNISTPLAWQIISFLLISVLIVAVVFLSLASYAHVETVPGQIALDRGVTAIVPSRAGTILDISVREGERVRGGQKLALIRAEERLIGGASAPDRIRKALNTQDARLAEQSDLLLRAARADQSRLKAQIDGDRAAIPGLERQIADQRELIATAESDYNDSVDVAKRGYISKRDMEERQATILTRRQQLAQLEQALSSKRSEIAQAARAMVQSAMAAQAQVADTDSSRAALSQQQAETELARGYSLTSPVDGTVTALTARVGQPAVTGQQLMLVVPSNAQPRVELYVPPSASGFLAPGEEVRLSIDAYPYQTFGTVKARVTSISGAAISRQTQDGPSPIYLVNASIPRPWVMAFGRKQALVPGMTLSARIITQKRSLIEWLFEPLFAVRKR